MRVQSASAGVKPFRPEPTANTSHPRLRHVFKVDIITETLEQDRVLCLCTPAWYWTRTDCTEKVDSGQKTRFAVDLCLLLILNVAW